LSPPPGPRCPATTTSRAGGLVQALGAVGYSLSAPEIVADLGSRRCRCARSRPSRRVRQAIGRRVVEALPGQTGAIANALITGEPAPSPNPTNQAFRDSGLFHILSISGLHMVIMAGAVFFCIRLALRRSHGSPCAFRSRNGRGGGQWPARSAIS